MKKLLADFDKTSLSVELASLGAERYRARQVYEWINRGADFPAMSNVPKVLRDRLAEKYDAIGVEIIKESVSRDGTVKFLFRLRDGSLIEGVLMKYKYGYTMCISTQVGCRMGCVFCASGKDGLLRNLTAGEMLGEVICVNSYLTKKDASARIGNVVLMGSGEPLDNYENVAALIHLLTEGQGVGQRGISLSTCGVTGNMRRLADDGFSVTLCISLHSPFDDVRVRVMPSGKSYKIADIIAAAEYYFEKSGRRVVFEYAMMRGFNISAADAKALANLVKNFPCHVNLIPLNETSSTLSGVTRREAYGFLKMLAGLGVSATIRRSLGEDIDGACGQLKRKYAENNGG